MPTLQDELKTKVLSQKPLPPLTQRLWHLIADKPGLTGSRIASLLNEKTANVSTLLSQLEKRKMLVSELQYMQNANGRKYVKIFSVNPSMRGVYELLPMPSPEKIVKDKIEKAVKNLPDKPVEAPKVQPAEPTTTTASIDVGKLTVNEARSLYKELHALFGG